jgi:hypothetical protein
MTTQNYLMINPSNIVENIILWDGGSEWTPPIEYTVIPKATTSSIVWEWNLSLNPPDWQLTQTVGNSSIGDSWNGTTTTTNQPKPTWNPFETSGLQQA